MGATYIPDSSLMDVTPLQGYIPFVFLSQGVALGWYISPFQGQIRAIFIISIVMVV